MPMLLRPEQIDGWLSGAIGRESLVPAREEMLQTWTVSRRVNSSRTDENDATLIEGLTV
jgi:putative SOS response-associated peptidase YedK